MQGFSAVADPPRHWEPPETQGRHPGETPVVEHHRKQRPGTRQQGGLRVVRVVRVVRFGAPADEAPDAAVRSLEVGTPETPDPETRTAGLVDGEGAIGKRKGDDDARHPSRLTAGTRPAPPDVVAWGQA